MPHIYIHPSFPLLTGGPTGPARITHPFWGEGDYTTIQIEQDWIQSWTTYKPLPLNTPIDFAKIKNTGFVMPPNASACIYLEDTEPQDIGFGCCQVTRRWGTVPIERRKPLRLSVNYFGQTYIQGTYEVTNAWTYTQGVASQYYNNTISTTHPAQNFVSGPLVGTPVYGVFGVQFRFQSGGIGSPATLGGSVIMLNNRRARITSISPLVISEDNGWIPKTTSEMRINVSPGQGGASATFLGWQDLPTPAKGPRTKTVSGYTIYRYFTGLSEAVFNSSQQLEIITAAGSVTDTISTTSDISLSRWNEMKNNGESFVAEDSEVNRWKGDIYEVATNYAPARP